MVGFSEPQPPFSRVLALRWDLDGDQFPILHFVIYQTPCLGK